MGLNKKIRSNVIAAIAAGSLLAIGAATVPAMAASQAAGTSSSAPAKLPLSAAQMRADERLHNAGGTTATSGLPAGSGGSVTGRAQSAAGAPLAGICVTAYGPSGDKSAVTKQAGQFLISGLKPGRYQLQYRGCDPAKPYLPEWYGGAFGRSQSASVVVSGLQPQPLHPVTMYALGTGQTQFPSFGFGRRDGTNNMAADPFGRRLEGPVSAAALTRSLASKLASSGTVQPAAVTARHGKLSGRVTSPAGKGLAGICVEAFSNGSADIGFTQTGKTGTYSVGGLAPGSYELIFFAECGNTGNWLTQIYKNKYSFNATPTAVHVRAAKTTSGVNAVLRPGGEISGTVTGPLGKKLSNICVSPLPVISPLSNAQPLPVFTAISHDGIYHVRGVPAGSYQLGFSPCGTADYSPTLWPGTQNYNAAATIKMRPHQIVGNIDAVMQLGGIISGTVTSAADPSVKLSGMCLSVEENNGLGTFGFTATDANGGYIIKGLSPGSYEVDVETGCNNNGNYVGVTYPGNVTVDYGQHQKGIDLAMPTGAIISGTVTSAATSQPVKGICVEVSSDDALAEVQTAANGSYSVNQLPADSDYQVQFFGGCGNSGSYAPQGYNNTSVLFPQNIAAAAGQVITGIDAVMQPGPAIAGKVTNTAGRKLGGICVFGFSPGGVQYGGAATTASGRYDMTDLAPGQYQVVFLPGCNNNADLAAQWFRSQGTEATAALVSATAGTVHGINGVLAAASGISGTLRSKGGRELDGGCLDLTGVSGAAKAQDDQVFILGSQYEVTGMPLGSYQVVFQPNCFGGGYENQWYKDKPGPAHATSVAVVAGRIHAHINSAVIVGGTITGEITSGGEPVHDMCVYAQNVAQEDDYNVALSTVQGRYVIRGLNSGQYELEVSPCSTKTEALADVILPRLVHVSAPKQTAGVNISVPDGGSVTGSVSGGSPTALQPGVCVLAVQVNGANGNLTTTAADGTYTIGNLPAGQYQLYFGDPWCGVGAANLAPQWYPDSQTQFTAGSVTVTASATTTVTATTLSTDGSIAGTVTGPGGTPLAGVCVAATPPGAGQIPQYSVTRASGSYLIGDVAPGQYRVQFSSGCGASGYLTQWWHGAASRQKATLVEVTAGTTTTGISATLRK